MKLISFTHEGTEYNNFDADDADTYQLLCNTVGKETLDEIISDIDSAANQPSDTDILGQTVADLTLQNMQLNSTMDTLGAALAQAQLDIMALKGGAS